MLLLTLDMQFMMSEQEALLVLSAPQRKYFATVETCFFKAYVKTAPERQVPEILHERVQMQKE